MSEHDMLNFLVKSRERCRHLIQFFRKAREQANGATGAKRPDAEELRAVNGMVTQLLSYLQAVPRTTAAARGGDIARVIREVGELLESAVVAEREYRESLMKPAGYSPAWAHKQAMRHYGNA